jgi:hypothetical protein
MICFLLQPNNAQEKYHLFKLTGLVIIVRLWQNAGQAHYVEFGIVMSQETRGSIRFF